MKPLPSALRPISFGSESIHGIERDLKTQSRRVMYPQPTSTRPVQVAGGNTNKWIGESEEFWPCPYGVVGDRLWVREIWARVEPTPAIMEDYRLPIQWRVEKNPVLLRYWLKRIIFLSDFPGKKPEQCGRGSSDNLWRSPVTMPRWASRQLLEVTNVRVERLHEITEEDAKAEGVSEPAPVHGAWCDLSRGREGHWSYRKPFADRWDAINGKKNPWSTNPWVWALTFRKIEGSRQCQS